jgi:monofunctional chorismate mutase|uniref:Chorismate mutase domain-containing protein n=1 Tax=viral metagenome TaxID=1070528 RepID=A0A6C0IW12_9ZZZZ
MSKLDIFREEIDDIDDQILDLLIKRMSISIKVGKFKKENNITILNSNRENEVLERLVNKNNSIDLTDINRTCVNNVIKIDDNFIKNLWINLMDYSKELQKINDKL